MFKQISKIMNIIFRGIAAIIAVSLVISLISNFFSADEIDKDHQRVIAEFKSIQHPKDSKEISHKGSQHRGALYTVEYQYNLDDKGVENYYDKELKKHGWEKRERRKYDPPKNFSYTKGKGAIDFSSEKDNVWIVSLHYRANN